MSPRDALVLLAEILLAEHDRGRAEAFAEAARIARERDWACNCGMVIAMHIEARAREHAKAHEATT